MSYHPAHALPPVITLMPCPWCLGTGVLLEQMDPYWKPWEVLPIRCIRCVGRGKIIVNAHSGER